MRRAVGWTVKRDDLIADPSAPRVATTWLVAANLSEVQPDKLRRLETWMINANPTQGQPHVALLIDFVPVSGGAFGFPYEPGETIAGEVVFYPSAAPLRGLLAERKPSAEAAAWPRGHAGLGPALDDYARRLGALPWLDAWPLLADGLAVRSAGDNVLVLADSDGHSVPIERAQGRALMPMIGLDDLSALFVWNGRQAHVLAIDTRLGRWHED